MSVLLVSGTVEHCRQSVQKSICNPNLVKPCFFISESCVHFAQSTAVIKGLYCTVIYKFKWHSVCQNLRLNLYCHLDHKSVWYKYANQWLNLHCDDLFIKAVTWRNILGWVGLWGFLWWAPSAKRKDHQGVSSGWNRVWHRSNTGLSSTQYEQIPIILGVWPFWLTPFFFRSITFWRAYG